MNVIEPRRSRLRRRRRQGNRARGSARHPRGARVPPQNIAGTSAGAITAALLAAGHTAAELREIIISLDYRQFHDRAWEDKVPLVERSLSLLLDLGLYEGDRFLEWIRAQLEAKGVHLRRSRPGRVRRRSALPARLQVIASDVEARAARAPRDARKLGIEPDDLDVALAVWMSMSILVFFEPVRFENPETGQVHVIVDGGMLELPGLALRLRGRRRPRVAHVRAAPGRAPAGAPIGARCRKRR